MKITALLALLAVSCVSSAEPSAPVTSWNLNLVGQGWVCRGSMVLTAEVDRTDGNISLSGPFSCSDGDTINMMGIVAGEQDARLQGIHLQVSLPVGGFFIDGLMNDAAAWGYTSGPSGVAGFSAGIAH